MGVAPLLKHVDQLKQVMTLFEHVCDFIQVCVSIMCRYLRMCSQLIQVCSDKMLE